MYGSVFSKEDKLPLPGATVLEKGTQNGAATSIDGKFTLDVSNPNAILVISFIGFLPQEIHLNGKDAIEVMLKSICYKDFFDHQVLSLFAMSGVFHTPVGGRIELSLPAFYRDLTLKSAIGLQSDLNENKFYNAQIELNHFLVTCDFDMDAKWHYRKVNFDQNLRTKVNSVEADLNFSRPFWSLDYLNVIIGYSNLYYRKSDALQQNSTGPVLGLGTYTGEPLRLYITGKAAIFRDNVEYQGDLNRQFKWIHTFAKVYSLGSFTEISLGAGFKIGYN
ncbi:hypothetical protein GCM10027189_26840 [Rufibacter soli]